MKSLKEIREEVKNRVVANGKKFKVRIPNPDKEFAKQNGARWDKDMNCFIVVCADITAHPLKNFSVDSEAWAKVIGRVPFDYKDELKEHGLVTEVENGVWSSWVLLDEKYQELAATLVDLELLDLGGTNE